MTPYTKKSLIALGVLTLAFIFSQWRLSRTGKVDPKELAAFKEAMKVEGLDMTDPKNMQKAMENKFSGNLAKGSIKTNKKEERKEKGPSHRDKIEKMFKNVTHEIKKEDLQGVIKLEIERGLLSDFEYTFELPETADLTDEEIIGGLNLVAIYSIEGKASFKSSEQAPSLKKELEKDFKVTKKESAKALVLVGEDRRILPCKATFIFSRTVKNPNILLVETSIVRGKIELPEGKNFTKTGTNLSNLAFSFKDSQEIALRKNKGKVK